MKSVSLVFTSQLVLGCFGWQLRQVQHPFKTHPSGSFDWSKIKGSDTLKWHKCFEQHECARLQVPTDWQHPDHDKNTTLAVIRLPAQVSRSDPTYGGSILINPGGPGASGIQFLRWGGLEIQSNVDGDKHYDIVSWDTRGGGATTPSAACFASNLDRQAFDLKNAALGHPDDSDTAFREKWIMAKAFGQICNSTDLKFLSTLSTAKDMVALIDALDPKTHKPLLNYWGFSYGSLLGNVFASAFPDRMGRVILDGVVDADDYMRTGWTTNLDNTDTALDYFYSTCWQADTKCPISEPAYNDIRIKVEAFLEKIRYEPIPVSYEGRADFVQHSDVINEMFGALYQPAYRFPALAQILYDLMNGNASSIAPKLARFRDPHSNEKPKPLKPSNNSHDNDLPPGYDWQSDATRAIMCGDGDDITHRTAIRHHTYMTSNKSKSRLFGGLWSQLTAYCVHWPQRLRPADSLRFTGPFGSKLADYSKGASPILFIGNLADPATPLNNAYSMSDLHEGSLVLETWEKGHCTGPLTPNKCVYEHVRTFFNEGTLPPIGMVCAPDKIPWQ